MHMISKLLKDCKEKIYILNMCPTDVQNRLLDSVGEGKGGIFRENSIETCLLSRVKQITSLGWMHETSAQGWCTGRPRGIGWRGRWEGGSGWGIHVNSSLIHVNVW